MPRLLLLLAVLLCLPAALRAQATVKATLSHSEAQVGDTIEYRIEITGAQNIDRTPPAITPVPGLLLGFRGMATNYRMYNFVATSSTSYTYSVTGDTPGDYTIPAQTVRADGTTFTTDPVHLKILPADPRSAPGASTPSGAPDTINPPYKSALRLPKDTAYVGEILPAQLTIAFDESVKARLEALPQIRLEGFIVHDLAQPEQSADVINGKPVRTITFRTALSAVKPGKFTLPPVETQWTVSFLQKKPPGSRRPGQFDPNDPFSNPLFDFDSIFGGGSPFQTYSTPRTITLRSPAKEIQIKPLPTADQPESFTGGVGRFTLKTTATPDAVQTGEPVTLTVRVSGTGNFARLGAPVLDAPGSDTWRIYPPEEKFEPSDDIGSKGVKTFTYNLIPQRSTRALPPVRLAYFDPELEKYITLEIPGEKISVTGPDRSTPAPDPSAPVAKPLPDPTPAAPAAPPALALLDEKIPPSPLATFTPLWREPMFWLAQAVPLSALLAWLLLHTLRHPGPARLAARHRATVRARLRQLAAQATAPGLPRAEAYRLAEEHLHTALRELGPPGSPEVPSDPQLLQSVAHDPGLHLALRDLLAHRDQARYAGDSATPLSPEESAALANTLALFAKSIR